MPPKKPPPGNPQWIEWLEEWETQLSGKSEHLPKAIRKAIQSFKANPVPIDHPANSAVLKGVGPKMIAYLTTRLKKDCEENGLEMPVARVQSFEAVATKAAKKRKKAMPAEAPPMDAVAAQLAAEAAAMDDGFVAPIIEAPDAPSSSNARTKSTKPAKPRISKAYAPKIKSGSFAIILGLASYGADQWKPQEEIVLTGDPFFGTEGQSIIDSKGGANSSQRFYSGWSAMSDLIKREIIEKKGKAPVQYKLTYKGWKIARKAIRTAKKNVDFDNNARAILPDPGDSDDSHSEQEEMQPQASTSASVRQPTRVVAAGRSIDPAPRSGLMDLPPESSEAPFLYWYLNNRRERVRRQNLADVDMDPVEYTPRYLIEFRQCQSHHIFAKRNITGDIVPLLAPTGPEGKTCTAFLARNGLPLCPGFDALRGKQQQNTATSPVMRTEASHLSSSASRRFGQTNPTTTLFRASSPPSSEPAEPTPRPAKKARPSVAAVAAAAVASAAGTSAPAPAASTARPSAEVIDVDSDEDRTRASGSAVARFSASDAASSTSRAKAEQDRLASFERLPMTNLTTPSLAGPSTSVARPRDISQLASQVSDCFIMQPGSYDIMLLIDTREKPGLSSKKLEKLLTDKGIKWEARVLSMGDAVWIAKHRATGTEVVLDCCLERKRLDDLLSSLKDGRYAEQKNRMKMSGISRLLYLVEEYDYGKLQDTYGQQIWTIKSSLQVIEDFNVHIALTVHDACNYLAILTTTFVELYQHTALSVLPDSIVKRDTFFDLIGHLRKTRPATSYFTTFQAYQNINTKVHTIASTWAKMVVSIDKMSVERAVRFTERFPNPASFLTELEGAISANMAEEEHFATSGAKRKRGEGTHGECFVMRQTVNGADPAAVVRPIGQALSTTCWKLFTAEKY